MKTVGAKMTAQRETSPVDSQAYAPKITRKPAPILKMPSDDQSLTRSIFDSASTLFRAEFAPLAKIVGGSIGAQWALRGFP